MADPIKDLLSTINTAVTQNQNIRDQLGGNAIQILGAEQDAIKLAGQSTDQQGKTPAQVAAETQGKLTTEQNVNFLANSIGVTGGDPNDILVKLGVRNNQLFEQIQKEAFEIDRLNGVSLLDNPVQWLVNQFKVDDVTAQYNADVNQYNIDNAHISNINEQVQHGAATYKDMQRTVDEAAAKSAVTASAAQINLAQKMLEIGAYKDNAEQLLRLNAMDMKQVELLNNAYSAYAQSQSIEMQRAHLKLAQDAARRAAAENSIDESSTVAAYKAGFKDLYGTEPDITSLKDLKALQSTPRGKERYDAIIDRGMQIKYNVRGAKQYGITPSDTLNTIRTLGVPLSKSQQDLFDNVYGKAEANLRNNIASGGSRDRTSINSFIDTVVSTTQANDAKEIIHGRSDNIYHAPDMASIIDYTPIKANKVVKAVIAPRLVGGKTDMSPQEVAEALQAAVANKLITPDQAANAGAEIYAAAIALNNTNKAYEQLAIKPQANYNARIKVTPNIIKSATEKNTNPLLFPANSALYNAATSNDVYDLSNINDWKYIIMKSQNIFTSKGDK